MTTPDASLLAKVAKSLAAPSATASSAGGGSLLVASAQSYGSRPIEDDLTLPTGFDPQAAALFEAVVEAAYLVANADGHFDDDEKTAFERVVIEACGENVLDSRQVDALLEDLTELLSEDGLDARITMIGKTVKKPEQAFEVLRIASLLAHVSGGVSDDEKQVLLKLAAAFSLGDDAANQAISEAERALSS